MNTFKRILAWTLLVLSVIGILVCTFGIFGSWAINNDLTQSILKLLSSADTALSRVEGSLTLASTQLEAANSAIATAREAASQLGDRIENNSPILDKIIGTLKDEVGPAINKVREVLLQIEDRIQSVNSTIEVVNKLPGIELPTLNLELKALRDQVNKVDDAVQQLQKNILDFRAGIVKTLAPLGDKIDTIAGFLTKLEQDVNTYLKQVQNLQVAVKSLQAKVPSTIDNLTILITVLLLWNILAQASLILLSSLYIRTGRMVWDISASEKPSSKEALPAPGA